MQGKLAALFVRAWRAYPRELERIRKGWELARTGQVVVHQDKSATVTSLDGERTYQVHGKCPCPDARFTAPGGRCKHRFATNMALEALEGVPCWQAQAQHQGQYLGGTAYGYGDDPVFYFLPAGATAGVWLAWDDVVLGDGVAA